MRKLFIIALLNVFVIPNYASSKKFPGFVSVSYQTVVNGKSNPDDGRIMW